MTVRLCAVLVAALIASAAVTSGQAPVAPTSARVLFYDPALGTDWVDVVRPSAVTRLTPVRPPNGLLPWFVGIHYWFEDSSGTRYSEATMRELPAGVRLRLHLRSNVLGRLTVFTENPDGTGLELTSRDNAWSGQLLDGDREYVVPGDFTRAAPEDRMRVLVLFARAQSEQVVTPAQFHEKLARLSSEIGSDGAPLLVREDNPSTPGQIGTYVVHRAGLQPGVEILLRR